MGNEIRDQAEKLGLLELPGITLYAHPSGVRQTFARIVPHTDNTVQNYISQIDPSFVKGRSGGSRGSTYVIYAPNANIYFEDQDLYIGWAHNEKNHLQQIKIHADTEEKIRHIAQIIDNLYTNGVVANINWKKINKKYKVDEKEGIAMWNKVLNKQTTKPSSIDKLEEFKVCSKCGKENPIENKFCIECGNEFPDKNSQKQHPKENDEEFKKCSKCGKENPIKNKFCIKCGNKF